MTDKQQTLREAFEEWYKSYNRDCMDYWVESHLKMVSDDEYDYTSTNMMWKAFKEGARWADK